MSSSHRDNMGSAAESVAFSIYQAGMHFFFIYNTSRVEEFQVRQRLTTYSLEKFIGTVIEIRCD